MGLCRGNQANMRSLGWALSQYDGWPYKERKCGGTHTLREDDLRTQGGDGHLPAKERGLELQLLGDK